MIEASTRIFLAGHRGLVGSAILRRLEAEGFSQVLTRPRGELDLTDQAAVDAFFAAERPEVVILAAAKVGGIQANHTRPADFARDNLLIQTHAIDAAWRHGAAGLLFLGSSCIYPREAPQPMREEHLLTGPLEPTNAAYAVAKIAGITMARAYATQHGLRALSLMPTNLYGPGDDFDLKTSHVLPALLRKVHEAKRDGAADVEVWGSGTPRREFLHVDDLADACLHLLRHPPDHDLINVGVGKDTSIRELAELICEVVGFEGALRFDPSMPDGAPRKLLDVSRLSQAGWRAKIGLREGIAATYAWYLEHEAEVLARPRP
jgi:GDP-L-fucose synthase